MDIARLHVFRDVVRQGSLAGAARVIGVHPSVVSRSIGVLEAELGVRLLQRTTRRLMLTEAGARFLDRIEPLLDGLSAAGEEARGLVERPEGRLRVTASNGYGQTVVAPMLAAFREAYPQVHVELLLTDALIDLVAERVDVALRLGPRPAGDLVVARLATATFRAVASPSYLDRAPPLMTPGELAGHPCLIAVPDRQQTWTFRQDRRVETVVAEGVVATSNTLVLRRCAVDGLGIAVLPDWLSGADLSARRLAVVLPEWQVSRGGDEAAVWIAYPSRSYLPSKTRVFIDSLRASVRSADPQPSA